MTATTTVPPEVATYLARVRSALRDLPAPEREDLLAEVEASIAESAGDGQGTIAARLGSPEEFAAELRGAAGLAPATPPAVPTSRWERLTRQAGPARRIARELAPAWWLVRGFVVAALLAGLLAPAGRELAGPLFRFTDLRGLMVLGVMATVGLSVLSGLLARRRGPSSLLAAINVVLAVAAVPVLYDLSEGRVGPFHLPRAQVTVVENPSGTTDGLVNRGVPVDNLYVFTRDGKRLRDVLVYDGNGTPVDIADQAVDPDRRLLRTKSGDPVFNSFPIRYFEPGTHHVAHPGAGPSIEVPRLRESP